MKILLLKTKSICYDSTDYFLNQIAKELTAFGHMVSLLTIRQLFEANPASSAASLEKENYHAILTFNLPYSVLEKILRPLLLHTTLPVYNYILDHPLYHHKTLMQPFPHFHILCLDENHATYIRTYYPHIKSVTFLPLAATVNDRFPAYKERSIPILFTGTYTSSAKIRTLIQQCHPALQKEMEAIEEIMFWDTNLIQEEAVQFFLKRANASLTKVQFREILPLHFLLDTYIRAFFREKIIQTLLTSRISLTVAGHGWNTFSFENSNKNGDSLKILKERTFQDTLKLMEHAKIVLNINPWFKAGAHDRIFSALLNGAVCLTDNSSYLFKEFQHNQDLVYYHLKSLDELPDQIFSISRNEKKAADIAQQGYSTALSKHTWQHRAKRLLALFETNR